MINKNNIAESYYRFLNIPSGDLRISITNACNMNCVYCHNEGQSEESLYFLSLENIKDIVEKTKRYGLTKVRLTGGDPLVHPDILSICRMLKKDLKINNLGLNTNGYRACMLEEICDEQLLDQVVIGMDFFDSNVSKNSLIGPSSKEIKKEILNLKNKGINVQIATVFTGNINEIFLFVEWALNNGILLKIIEVEKYDNDKFEPGKFDKLIEEVRDKFRLKIGITADLREIYLYCDQGKVLFFQSHCNRGECHLCRNMHLRINAQGKAKPCMFRKEAYDLLNGEFDLNIRKAIANLGISPDKNIV